MYASPEFRRLASVRGRFVRTAVLAQPGWFAVFLVLIGAAPAVAGQVVVAGMTVGFLLGLSQFVLAWLLTWRYLRLSESVFSPLKDGVVAGGGRRALTRPNDDRRRRGAAHGPDPNHPGAP
ncbi:DUF485 domain-containing protein [Pseudonocardia sp. DLS-67]